MLKENDIDITNKTLRLKDANYLIEKITDIEAIERSGIDCVKRTLIVGFVFFILTMATGASADLSGDHFNASIIGLTIFGMLGAFLTFKKYELRATFKATDESGDQTFALLKSMRKSDFTHYQRVAHRVSLILGKLTV